MCADLWRPSSCGIRVAFHSRAEFSAFPSAQPSQLSSEHSAFPWRLLRAGSWTPAHSFSLPLVLKVSIKFSNSSVPFKCKLLSNCWLFHSILPLPCAKRCQPLFQNLVPALCSFYISPTLEAFYTYRMTTGSHFHSSAVFPKKATYYCLQNSLH